MSKENLNTASCQTDVVRSYELHVHKFQFQYGAIKSHFIAGIQRLRTMFELKNERKTKNRETEN